MSFSLRYTPETLRDMDAVWDDVYEASKSFDIADKYVKEFANLIADKKYKAFYRVREDYIEVVRIIMVKRDYMRTLFGETE